MRFSMRVLGFSGGFPAAGRATSGYLVQIGNKNILVDCGSGVLSELQKYISISQIDAIILTHLHHDHISDMGVLQYALQMHKKKGELIEPIPLYITDRPQDTYDRVISGEHFAVHHINDNKVFDIFGVKVSFVTTIHPVPCFAVRIDYESKSIVYSSDTSYFSDFSRFAQDADLLVLDCGALESDKKAGNLHMTPKECFEIYSSSQAKRVVLSHLIPYYSISDTVKEASSFGIWPFEIPLIGSEYILKGEKK